MRNLFKVHTFALMVIFACTGFFRWQYSEAGTNSEAKMKALINRYYDAWNEGNLDASDKILSENYVRHEDAIGRETIEGIEAMKEHIWYLRTGYPGFKVSFTNIFINADRVITVWNFKGTQTGPLENLAPTGNKVDVSGVLISRVSNGKIIEDWSYYNRSKVLTQLGYTLMPPEQKVIISGKEKEQVIINGVALSEPQIAEIVQTYAVKPQSGNYWYDTKSGLYGVVGYAAYGFMFAGHNFGSIDRNASSGDTGVIVNGRELPQSEWAVWSQVLGYWIQPGSYWFDQNGNAGYEGSPIPLVNLYVAAQQNAYRGMGGVGDNFWSSRFGAGNFDSGNQRGYVSVPGYGPVGYGF